MSPIVLGCSQKKTQFNRATSPRKLSQKFMCFALASCMSTAAVSDNALLAKKYSISLPQQSLARSITDLAEQAGLVVLLKPGQLRELQAQPLNGSMSLSQALEVVLSNSGYGFSLDGKQLRLHVDTIQESSLTVYGTRLSRYEFDEAESATGFRADVDELPRSVQVLPEQLALDQNASDLTDVLVNAAGVTRAHGFGGAETQVNIRGFTNSHLFVDGNPVSSRHNIDLANVESAEVILGPASVLHGQVSPGGLVNIVTKKPQEESAHSIQLELDEYGKQKVVFDSTGSLSDDLQYRLIISGEDSDSFREVSTVDDIKSDESKSFLIAPSFRYTPNDTDTFTLSFSHTEQDLPIDRGNVVVQATDGSFSVADIPRERRLGSEFDSRDSTEHVVQFDWEHSFKSGWENRFKLGFYEKDFDDYQARPVFGFNAAPANLPQIIAFRNSTAVQENGLLARTADTNLDVSEQDFFISNSLTGDYRLGNIENTLYVGANYYVRKIDDTDGFALLDASALVAPGIFAPAIDVIDIYAEQQPAYARQTQTRVSRSEAEYTEYGLSVQNLSYVTDRLNLLAGLRYDHFKIDSDETIFYQGISGGLYQQLAVPQELNIHGSNSNVSGQFGVIYDLTDSISVYGSFSESFLPNYPDVTAGVVTGNANMDPEEATQFELGLKSSLMNDRLRLTLSAYDLKRKNVLTFDNLLQARLNGEERTRGVDLSSTLQFVPGLNVLMSYSYMDSEIVEDNDDSLNNEGNRPFSVPENKARIWGSYEFQGGDFSGLGLGLGAEYVDDRYGNDANTFKIPGYTVFDAAAWYYIPVSSESQIRLQAGVRNLTDRTYYTANGSGNTYRVNVGDPRTFYMTARYEF